MLASTSSSRGARYCKNDDITCVYAQVMSSFLQYLAPRLDEVLANMPEQYRERRAMATSDDDAHARIPSIVADLYIGGDVFFKFAVEVGAVSQLEADAHLKQIWAALLEAAAKHSNRVREQDPVDRFLGLVRSA